MFIGKYSFSNNLLLANLIDSSKDLLNIDFLDSISFLKFTSMLITLHLFFNKLKALSWNLTLGKLKSIIGAPILNASLKAEVWGVSKTNISFFHKISLKSLFIIFIFKPFDSFLIILFEDDGCGLKAKLILLSISS